MKILAAVFMVLLPQLGFANEPQAAGFENNMGGWTVIANRNQYCGGMSMYDGYAFGKGLFTRFCWIKRGDSILAVLEDGETRVWPIQSFELMSVEPDINNQL